MDKNNLLLANKNLVAVAILIVLGVGAYIFLMKDNISHSELFELKQNCAKLAQEFVEKKTGPGIEGVNQLTWKVLHSDYNVKKKSCFAELDMFSYFPNTNESFSEYRIYDLLNGINIESLTYFDKNPGNEEWVKYLVDKSPKYYKLRKEVFGLGREEY